MRERDSAPQPVSAQLTRLHGRARGPSRVDYHLWVLEPPLVWDSVAVTWVWMGAELPNGCWREVAVNQLWVLGSVGRTKCNVVTK